MPFQILEFEFSSFVEVIRFQFAGRQEDRPLCVTVVETFSQCNLIWSEGTQFRQYDVGHESVGRQRFSYTFEVLHIPCVDGTFPILTLSDHNDCLVVIWLGNHPHKLCFARRQVLARMRNKFHRRNKKTAPKRTEVYPELLESHDDRNGSLRVPFGA